jgi:hypothetical protein
MKQVSLTPAAMETQSHDYMMPLLKPFGLNTISRPGAEFAHDGVGCAGVKTHLTTLACNVDCRSACAQRLGPAACLLLGFLAERLDDEDSPRDSTGSFLSRKAVLENVPPGGIEPVQESWSRQGASPSTLSCKVQ